MGKTFLFITSLFCLISFNQEEFRTELNSAFSEGNHQRIASFFNDNTELIITDKQDTYSPRQGEQVLKRFFTENQPTNFQSTRQQELKNKIDFLELGTLNCNNDKSFQVSIFYRREAEKFRIYKLWIKQ